MKVLGVEGSGKGNHTVGSLSSDVFERRTSTGNGLFAHLSRDFEQIFGQIVSLRIKTLGNINTVASRLTRRENGSLPVDVRRSKTSLLKLPSNTPQTQRFNCRLLERFAPQTFDKHPSINRIDFD